MLEPLGGGDGDSLATSGCKGSCPSTRPGIYKPSPRTYQLAVDYLKLLPIRVGFVSSNGSDIRGGGDFGFTAIWVNRARAPIERHAPKPDAIVTSLAELPPLLGRPSIAA